MSRLDRTEVDRLILDSAQQANVLPLNSGCDSRCVFCSHKNNPPGVRVAWIGRRSPADVARTLAFLRADHVITIGESATPIIEGEPFTHPELSAILALVRRAFPDTPVEITTNGRFLGQEAVRMLEAVGNVALNVSLNSASVRGRGLLMGESADEAERAIAGIELLGRSSLRFAGSLVAMPNLVGWEDLRDTVSYLAANGAAAVRVIVPAYSALADRSLFPDDSIMARTREFVAAMSVDSPCPVLIEPSCVSDLRPEASGVLKESPAWKAGVRPGDVVSEINGRKPQSRVEAWQMLLPAGRVAADIARGGRDLPMEWINPAEGGSGVTFEYDFDPARVEAVGRAVAGREGRSLLLTSELGQSAVTCVLQTLGLGPEAAEAVAVRSLTFGGTIRAAGLLTVGDYLAAYAAWRRANAEPGQILAPVESFNSLGFDLTHRHVSELERLTERPVVLV